MNEWQFVHFTEIIIFWLKIKFCTKCRNKLQIYFVSMVYFTDLFIVYNARWYTICLFNSNPTTAPVKSQKLNTKKLRKLVSANQVYLYFFLPVFFLFCCKHRRKHGWHIFFFFFFCHWLTMLIWCWLCYKHVHDEHLWIYVFMCVCVLDSIGYTCVVSSGIVFCQ